MAKKQENFIVSARKYRPERWEDVIGQSSITETLHKSIDQHHLAHAYLFCGPRGVGKTTCARIFAKEINRSEEHSENEDFAFNIFELDAASNNSVEDIRALTDQVRIPPQVGKYKVYIIDEVHMLSKQAFNAFLKTLEEPPKHAIFILATTEKHKIIPTILSRCQIYDFNRILVDEIVEQLKLIAQSEQIKYEEEALHIVAQKADGAMRDALSIFDQLASFTNQNLTYEAVLKNLHVLDYDYYFKVAEFLSGQAYAEALLLLDDILKQGFDGSHFISGLSSHLRDLLVCQHPQTISLLEVGQTVKERYLTQAENIDADWIQTALPMISEAEFKYRNAPNQRLLLEVTLLNLCSIGLEKKNSDREQTLIKEKPQKAKQALDQKGSAADNHKLEETLSQVETASKVDSSTLKKEEEPVEVESEEKKVTEEPAHSVSSPIPTRTRKRKTTTVSLNADPIKDDSSNESKRLDEIVQESNSNLETKLDFNDAWKQLCDESLSEGRSALYSILVKQDVKSQLKDDVLTVQLGHEVDQEEFGQHSAHVLQRLRQMTSNQDLTMQTQLTEAKTNAKLFTTQEKFDHLTKQNPKLLNLKKDLDLDFL